MLMPKRVKYRKVHRGRRRGKAYRGSAVNFGDFGLKALEAGWITSRQIEACRVAISRKTKRDGTFVKKTTVPLKMVRFIIPYPFDIKDKTLFQLVDNEDTEEWELHQIPIH